MGRLPGLQGRRTTRSSAGLSFARGAVDVTVKLTQEEREIAHLLPYVRIASHVGRYGWITANVTDEESLEAALEWLRESYWLKCPAELKAAVEGDRLSLSPAPGSSSARSESAFFGVGSGRLVELVVAVVLARVRSILLCHEGRPSRLVGTRTSGRRDRPRRRRAIGPKLAEQAVLVRSNGQRPGPARAARGRAADPDPDHARHGRPRRALRAAPLDRAPARRGRAAALSRARRSRSGRRSRTASTTTSSSPSRSARRRSSGSRRRSARSSPRAARGTARRSPPRRRGATSPSRARTTRSSSSTPRRGRSRCTRRATSPTSAAGPHLQDSKPIKAVKLTGLAGAYWRGDEHNKQLTRIYGTAFYDAGRPRRVPRAARGGEARATTAGSGRSSTSSTSPSTRRGCRSGTRRGW